MSLVTETFLDLPSKEPRDQLLGQQKKCSGDHSPPRGLTLHWRTCIFDSKSLGCWDVHGFLSRVQDAPLTAPWLLLRGSAPKRACLCGWAQSLARPGRVKTLTGAD